MNDERIDELVAQTEQLLKKFTDLQAKYLTITELVKTQKNVIDDRDSELNRLRQGLIRLKGNANPMQEIIIDEILNIKATTTRIVPEKREFLSGGIEVIENPRYKTDSGLVLPLV